MKYITINLYRKMIHYALQEGRTEKDFETLPIGIKDMKDLQAVPADNFFALHEMMNDTSCA